MPQEFCVTQEIVLPETESLTESLTETERLTETVRQLAQMVADHGLSELIFEEAGVTLTVKAAVGTAGGAAAPATLALSAHPHVLPLSGSPAYSQTAVAVPTAPVQASRETNAIALESPMVGVFYCSPSPDDPPFVNVGDFVKVGQPIGLIEAMKVYSEVPSEVSGRVVEMPVESGKLVQQGQPLIFVEPQ
jgi:acetyl-CoA carboxylase biotin carboxyl carrier protein